MADESILKAGQVMFANSGSQAEVAEPPVASLAAESTESAGMAAEQTATPVVEATTSEVVAPEAQPVISNEPYNYWGDLAQKSEGLVKDEDSLKTVLDRYKNYDTLAQEKETLEKNQWKPANEWVSSLDALIRDGAKTDQVKAFVKLNEYGNLDDLNPVEAKVAKMVLKDGYSEEMARKIVSRNFNFSQFDEEIPEQKDDADILREELRISANSDRDVLKEYRKDLSVVHNPEKESVEQAKLTEIANLSAYNKTVESQAPAIAKNFPAKLNFEFKIGEEVVKFEDSIPQDFLDKFLPGLVNDYFKDSLDPVNADSIAQAYGYAYGEYLKANVESLVENAYKKGNAEGIEKTVNKYENRSGLPKAQENTIAASNEEGIVEFMRKKLGKQ